jgi:RNA polymerase sigma-70 factor, ECF subfamily
LAPGTPDELELVERANRGDTAAFEALYRLHRDWVVSLAWRFTGSRDDALDVLQETFAYLFGRFPGFTLSSTLRAFLYPVVKHTSVSLARKRRRVVSLDAAERAQADAALEAAWQPDETAELDVVISSLAEGHREVLRLRFALGLQLDEIASALDVPLGTVKSRLHNALKALREVVEGRNS